jgi:hypothetical protein
LRDALKPFSKDDPCGVRRCCWLRWRICITITVRILVEVLFGPFRLLSNICCRLRSLDLCGYNGRYIYNPYAYLFAYYLYQHSSPVVVEYRVDSSPKGSIQILPTIFALLGDGSQDHQDANQLHNSDSRILECYTTHYYSHPLFTCDNVAARKRRGICACLQVG